MNNKNCIDLTLLKQYRLFKKVRVNIIIYRIVLFQLFNHINNS